MSGIIEEITKKVEPLSKPFFPKRRGKYEIWTKNLLNNPLRYIQKIVWWRVPVNLVKESGIFTSEGSTIFFLYSLFIFYVQRAINQTPEKLA